LLEQDVPDLLDLLDLLLDGALMGTAAFLVRLMLIERLREEAREFG
jgi:hypothetical protein